MVYIEEAEEVQHFIESGPEPLDIFWTGSILFDQCADDGEDGKQNEERDSEFERAEKVEEYVKYSLFLSPHRGFWFIHRALTNKDIKMSCLQGSIWNI